MNGQPSLLDAAPTLPPSTIEFLAGFITRCVYGENPSAEQKRRGRYEAEQTAQAIATLRNTPGG